MGLEPHAERGCAQRDISCDTRMGAGPQEQWGRCEEQREICMSVGTANTAPTTPDRAG